MQENPNTLFKILTGQYRYISYDGSSHFRTNKITKILDRPELKVGLACVAFNIVSAAFLNSDVTYLIQGQFNQISNLTKDIISTNSVDFVAGCAVTGTVYQWIANASFPQKNKAIDTSGQSDLPQSQLSLSDIKSLKKTKATSLGLSLAGAVFTTLSLVGENPHLSTYSVMLFAVSFLAFDRSSRILNGKYIICDEPPKKTQPQIQWSLGLSDKRPVPQL